MRALERLEGFIQELVERPAWLLGSKKLHPLELVAALTRALERDALSLGDRIIVPDAYVLHLNDADRARMAGTLPTLQHEFAAYITRLARERGLTLHAAVRVSIASDPRARAGAVSVTTEFSKPVAPSPALTRAAPRRARADAAPPQTEMVVAPAVVQRGMLEVLDARGGAVSRHALESDRLVIGRRAGVGLTLADTEVSREHASIEYDAPRYYLRDLGSLNGTWVNGRRISGVHPLADGDLIELGRSHLRFDRGG